MITSYDLVVINYQSSDLLYKLLSQFLELAHPPACIWVIDNASSDDPKKIEQLHDDINVVYNQKNQGFSHAANQGWRLCTSPIILFVNPDGKLLQDNYAEVVNYLTSHPKVGAVGPKILDYDGTVQGSARGFHSFWTFFAGRKGPITKLFPQSKIVKKDVPLLNAQGLDPVKVDWVSGACIFVKRIALEKAGGFDERFFMYFEDASLCKDLLALGWETHYFPKAVISHRVGESSKHKPIKTLWWFHQSWYRYLCKHHLKKSILGRALAANIVGLRFGLAAISRLAMGWLRKLAHDQSN